MTTPQETPNELFEHTRRHVENTMREVTGDDDFMPIIAVRTHNGDFVAAGLLMIDDQEAKDAVARTMTAICMVHRATEVAFTSNAWRVMRPDGTPPDVMPSQCADREEIAMISIVRLDGTSSLHTAPIIRENNMAGVGLWEDCGIEGATATGRFADAIRAGIHLGQQIIPSVGAYMDSQIAEGNVDHLIEVICRQIVSVQKGVQ